MSTKSAETSSRNVQPRALVLFPGALGDFICFLPALGALAATAHVDLFAQSEFSELVPESVRTRSLESYEINRLFAPQGADENTLRRFFAAYASIYSWMGSGHEGFTRQLQKLCHGRARIFPFTREPAPGHQSEYYLSCLGIGGGESWLPQIHLRTEFVAWSADYWARQGLAGRRVLLVAPGSGAREKNWPAEAFAAVAQWWRNEGGEPLVILGPAEEERGGCEPLLRQVKTARGLSLGKLAALIARGDVFLGNDSGVTHLAAALGIATVALFGPSAAAQWRPRGARVRIIRRALECSPCTRAVMKNCPHRSCLSGLDAGEAIAQLRALELSTPP